MVWFSLVVTSDRVYRGEREDKLTPLVREYLERKGHVLIHSTIVPNDPGMIRRAVLDAASRGDIVLVTGGTGPSKRDVTVNVLERIAERRLEGFGEAHRLKSMEKVGYKALLSRASAYQIGHSLIIVSPGAPGAVEVALEMAMDVAEHVKAIAQGASRWDKGCPGKDS